MKTKHLLRVSHFALGLLTLLSTINHPLSASAQGTAFTYQGRFNDGANPATGSYDFRFALYDAPNPSGTLVGGPLNISATAISNGIFTVTLDFGAVFNGADRWLEIMARTNGAGSFVTLSPRQKLTPTPYAITAENLVSGGLAAGTYGNAFTFNNPANSFTGNGASISNVNALTLGGLASSDFWRLNGNNVSASQFLGTTNNQPLEIRVNNIRALRIEPSSAPSLVGGYFQNNANGFAAVVIAGGGTSGSLNQALGNYAFVGAGHGGQAGSFSAVVDGGYNVSPGQFSFIGTGLSNTNLADFSFIGSGSNNFISVAASRSFIGGGSLNTNLADSAAIGGGSQNVASGFAAAVSGGFNNLAANNTAAVGGGSGNQAIGDHSVVAGGQGNVSGSAGPLSYGHTTVGGGAGNISSGDYSTVAGGSANTGSGDYATVAGGANNTIQSTGYGGTIGGGEINTIQQGAADSTISGGGNNTIQTGGQFGTIPGGYLNSAASFAFAAGSHAKANHQGSFVWADSQLADFASTANNQFNIRAAGGVRLSDDTPNLSFGATTRQMFNLFGAAYGIGVQSYRLYFRTDAGAGFAWFMAGTHNDATDNPGAGGTELMRLDNLGNLSVRGIVATNVSLTSDRSVKENFKTIDARSVLQKVAGLPLSEWNFKSDSGVRHIGPMAQDFYAAFNVGSDDKHIAVVDEGGVALAAIQGLNQKVEEKDEEIQNLKQRNDFLEERLTRIETALKQVANRK